MEAASKPSGLVFFPAFDWGLSPDHPEREERLLYTRDLLMEEGIADLPNIELIETREATDSEILQTHFCIPDIRSILLPAHRIASGSVMQMGDAVMSGRIRNGFAAVRPPGHHACRLIYGNRGFCDINNVAILTNYLRLNHSVRRIAIVDTDVHHGDGTQNIFWHDPDVLFISIHQDGRTLYPGTGFLPELGGPDAFGLTINLPMPPGSGDASYRYLAQEVIRPILDDFKPDIVINSAGQDCHFSDPLGSMEVTAAGYADLMRIIRPDIAVLEGGYAVESALPYIHLAIISAMADLSESVIKEPDAPGQPFQESEYHLKWANDIGHQALTAYMNRSTLRHKTYPDLQHAYTRDLRIFYDTTGIVDSEKETLTFCDQCHGVLQIQSEAYFGSGRNVYTIAWILPWNACDRCRNQTETSFEQVNPKSTPWDFIFLQDQSRNLFRSR